MAGIFCKSFFSLICLVCLTAFAAKGATYTVTSTANSGPGSLREAIESAVATPDDDTIVFNIASGCASDACYILLASSLIIDGGGSLTITNAGASRNVVISGNNSVRVFFISGPNVSVTLDSLTIANGRANGFNTSDLLGGGIAGFGGATVNIIDSTIKDNFAQNGGGIFIEGTLNLTNTTTENNTAWGGGGILYDTPSGTASIQNCIIRNNTATDDDGGGIKIVNGTVNVTASTIEDNSANAFGGGIYSLGVVGLTDSIVQNNSSNGDAGGIYAQGGVVNLNNSQITNNSAQSFGGGMRIFSATVTISRSTINNNRAESGGGIYSDATLTIDSSTIAANTAQAAGSTTANAGGGIFNSGNPLTITNSTISNNTVSPGQGGGIYNGGGTVLLKHSTITENSSPNAWGGGVSNFGSVQSEHTIFAYNAAPFSPDFYGNVGSQGYNLIENTSGNVIGLSPTDIIGLDPKLAPLGNYGGPTQTRLPLRDSPVINAGNPTASNLPAFDQRGSHRLVSGRVDIGSVEINNSVVTTTADSGPGSLREAVSGNFDNVFFNIPAAECPSGVCVITLNQPLEITSASASKVSNAGGSLPVELSGNNLYRIFRVAAGANLTIENLTIRNGDASASTGAAIFSEGTVTISNSTIRDTSAVDSSIFNEAAAMMNIYNSTITSNSGNAVLDNQGFLNVVNSTFSGNSANGSGGGISNSGILTLINSTISNNSASYGGGIFNNGLVRAKNTIIANNTASVAGPDFFGEINSEGHNLILDTAGITGGLDPSDITGEDPLLGPLVLSGGATKTRPLFGGSPAIDAGDDCVRTLTCAPANPPFAITTDQRGVNRTEPVDIGAFEANSGALPASLPIARRSRPFEIIIAEYDPSEVSYIFDIINLPPGLYLEVSQLLSPRATSVVKITGTPTQGGTFSPVLTITDTNSNASMTINYSLSVLAPTAAGVDIGGRILDSDGRGVSGAVVTLIDQNGTATSVRSNTFGFYRFTNVTAGQTVVVSVSSKQYSYQPQAFYLTDNVTDLNFVANGPPASKTDVLVTEKRKK